MSVLEGAFAADFYAAFADIYSDAVLTRVTMTDVNGTLTPSETNQNIKAQRDDLSEAARASAGYGDREVSILVLRQGVGEMDANCKITLYGFIYEVTQCRSDPVGAYWQVRATNSGEANASEEDFMLATVPVSSAEILNLTGAPKTLVAAPGAGLAIDVISVTCIYRAGATPYATGDQSSIDISIGETSLNIGELDQIISEVSNAVAVSDPHLEGIFPLAFLENQPVKMSNPLTPWINGDGTLLINIVYQVVPTA